jgi:outer membrane protein assembly factor BamD
MITLRRILVISILGAMLSGCGLFSEKVDKSKDWPVRRLYQAAKTAMDNGEYETAIDYYHKLESRFPFGRYAQQAQIDITYAYWQYDEIASALAAADRFIKLHPRHPNVDYAYYLKGLINFRIGRTFLDRFVPRDRSQRDPGAARQAFDDFSTLVSRFPRSKYSEDARQRMLYLKNTLARHEVNVADYYLRRSAYVAAANRARNVVENYQSTPAIPDALALMAKAYMFMDLDDLSADALRVLKLNYPNHEQIPIIEAIKKN